jgi:CheY-like chemotaxis protein
MTDKQIRILIADDERSIRWVLKESLTAAGHDVLEAENGTLALEILRQGNIDLAFVDIRMPEINGLDVVTAARV